MAPFSMFLALQPQLREVWQLSNTGTGWISSAYFTGYMVAVPVLVSLTDRYDARTIWLWSTTIAVGAALGFGLIAGGVLTALIFQFLAGASLAGTYMPGLKLIADRIEGLLHPRFVAFYTTSFTIGASVSFYLIGQLDAHLHWRTAVAISAGGPAAAWSLGYAWLRRVDVPERHLVAAGQHWGAVTRSPDVIRYVVGYACHTWELFAVRAWLVPFLAFCELRLGSSGLGSAATLAALISLVGVPASIAGAELTTRIDRRRLVTTVMWLSVGASVLFGLSSGTAWRIILIMSLIHSSTINADSAALTSGMVAVSAPQSRGTAMALYSMAGFGAASLGSFAVGGLLDLLGGESVMNWTIAFAVIGAPNVISALVLRGARR